MDTQDMGPERGWPPAPPVAVVRLSGVRTYRILDDEGGPVLVVSDGVTTVEFGCGLAGPSGRSVRGAHRVAEALEAYAAAIGAAPAT